MVTRIGQLGLTPKTPNTASEQARGEGKKGPNGFLLPLCSIARERGKGSEWRGGEKNINSSRQLSYSGGGVERGSGVERWQ